MKQLKELNLQAIKDYYQILQISKKADREEIKKSFRQLALAYHPDKNPGNEQAASYFLEIQEAYSVLSHPVSKRLYDHERAKLGLGSSAAPHVISSAYILKETGKLVSTIHHKTNFQINKDLLSAYLAYLISANNTAILLKENNQKNISLLIRDCLKILNHLDFKAFSNIEPALFLLADKNADLEFLIKSFHLRKKKESRYKVILPLLILVVTILLCLAMYLYGKN